MHAVRDAVAEIDRLRGELSGLTIVEREKIALTQSAQEWARLARRHAAERDEARRQLEQAETMKPPYLSYWFDRYKAVKAERDELRGRLEQTRTWAKELSRIDWRDLGPAAAGICSIADGNVPELGRET